MAARLRRPHAKTDGPPVFSHEFIIQNHADIISCVCMVIFLGLLPQVTNKLASAFIFLQYNKTVEVKEEDANPGGSRLDTQAPPETMYEHGGGDALNVVFYSLVWIIIHALLQEYIWERTVKKLHLSKVKTSKYLDSGCLVVFYALSLIWGVDHIVKEGYFFDWSLLWDGYPHTLMRLSLKFYMLVQVSFWVHLYPELYFMKTKKEELYSKVVLYTSSFLLITGAYAMMLQRLALILLVTHYSVDFLFHFSRLLHYHNKDSVALIGFKLWRVLFVIARLFTTAVSILTLWFGLKDVDTNESVGAEIRGIKLTSPAARLVALVFILLVQLWVSFTFLHYQLERLSDKPRSTSTSTTTTTTKKAGKATEKSSPRAKDKSSPRATNDKSSPRANTESSPRARGNGKTSSKAKKQ